MLKGLLHALTSKVLWPKAYQDGLAKSHKLIQCIQYWNKSSTKATSEIFGRPYVCGLQTETCRISEERNYHELSWIIYLLLESACSPISISSSSRSIISSLVNIGEPSCPIESKQANEGSPETGQKDADWTKLQVCTWTFADRLDSPSESRMHRAPSSACLPHNQWSQQYGTAFSLTQTYFILSSFSLCCLRTYCKCWMQRQIQPYHSNLPLPRVGVERLHPCGMCQDLLNSVLEQRLEFLLIEYTLIHNNIHLNKTARMNFQPVANGVFPENAFHVLTAYLPVSQQKEGTRWDKCVCCICCIWCICSIYISP